MKDPAIVFYTSDFMVGVSNLTMEERGQYITLLCLQHQLGHLSKKIIDLNVPNVSKDVLNKFITDEDGNFYNKRLEYEIEKRSKFVEHQRENGKKGGRPKKNPNETQNITQTKSKTKPLEDEDDIDNKNINNINNIYSYIENNYMRTLSPLEYEEINSWLGKFTEDIVKYAIQKSVENNAKKIAYVKAILNNWKSAGYKTLKDIKNDENKDIKKPNKELFDYDWLNDSLEE